MKFEHDPKKSAANYAKHGLPLTAAEALWNIPAVILEAKTIDEPRYMIVGEIDGKCYSCVYTTRGNAIRFISLRRSRKSEEKLYYEHIEKTRTN